MVLSAISEVITLSAVVPFLSIIINPQSIFNFPILSFFYKISFLLRQIKYLFMYLLVL